MYVCMCGMCVVRGVVIYFNAEKKGGSKFKIFEFHVTKKTQYIHTCMHTWTYTYIIHPTINPNPNPDSSLT